jgi:hypothetical protein
MSTSEYKLSKNFTAFFKRLNPSPTYTKNAAASHGKIVDLLEDKNGPVGKLRIKCFLQGSYKRETAIHTINDVDIVALCTAPNYSEKANRNTRDQIFNMIVESIARNKVYKDKVYYRNKSICVKIDLQAIRLEVLPALRIKGKPHEYEPFYMFNPNIDSTNGGKWQQTLPRRHQQLISQKNAAADGNFIPVIKVIKHLKALESSLKPGDAVSFHIECLLYALKDSIYRHSIGDSIAKALIALTGFTPDKAGNSGINTPCGDKRLFGPGQWTINSYKQFHDAIKQWSQLAEKANSETDKDKAITYWKDLLGQNYFPAEVQQ